MMTSLPVPKTLGLPIIRQRRRRMRAKLSAIALIVAVVTATGSMLIAQCAQACAMEHHTCHHTATIAPSCCDQASNAANQGGPIESRVRLRANFSPPAGALPATTFADISGTGLQIHTSSPSVSPPDFATRFAPLLI